ncbi:MAG TPA: hypothetical protein VE075_05960, partial [Thermoanaerobaculia bacterium]|nr:hypothetical protein [Thermoanaerobaculia bacterium]
MALAVVLLPVLAGPPAPAGAVHAALALLAPLGAGPPAAAPAAAPAASLTAAPAAAPTPAPGAAAPAPRRIVSLAPSLTETLFALGL